MAPAFSSTQEMAIAARKRPNSRTPSEIGSPSDDESASDFGAANETPRKPARKKARNAKVATQATKDDVLSKVPKAYRSEEDYPLFTAKWWKEILKRDEIWAAILKYSTKSALQKRFKIEIQVDLNDDDKKVTTSGKKVAATPAGNTTKAAPARKISARKAEDASTTDTHTDVDVIEVGVAPDPTAILAESSKGSGSKADSDVHHEAKSGRAEAEAGSNAREDDGWLSKIIADPKLTAEQRAHYMTIKEHQENAEREIEEAKEQKRLREERERARLAKRERKALELAKAVAEEGIDAGADATDITNGNVGEIEQIVPTIGENTETVTEDVTEIATETAMEGLTTASVEAPIEPDVGDSRMDTTEDLTEPIHDEIQDKESKMRKPFNPTRF